MVARLILNGPRELSFVGEPKVALAPSSGGPTIEPMTHIFDLARYLVSEIKPVCGVSARVPRTLADGGVLIVDDGRTRPSDSPIALDSAA